MSQKRGKMPYLSVLKNPSKTFLDPHPGVDNVQDLISSALASDISLVNFHKDPVSSFYAKLPTNRLTGMPGKTTSPSECNNR